MTSWSFSIVAGGKNTAVAAWTVVGHESLNLIEADLSLNMPLSVAEGSVDIALQAPEVLDDLFTFTLVAENRLGQVSVERTLAYVSASTPVVNHFGFAYHPGQRVEIVWGVESADSINIGYVPNGTPVENLTYLSGQTNVSGSRVNFPFNLIPAGGFGFQIVQVSMFPYPKNFITLSIFVG